MPTPVQLIPGSLPPGYCYPSDPQTFNVDIVTRIVAQLADTFPGIYVSDAEPPVQFRDRVWFQPLSTHWYYYINGMWQRKFDISSGSKKLYPFWGSAADVDIEDGGSPGAVGVSTGPLWVIDSTMPGRTWMGVGAVPGSDPALTLNEGDTGGVGSVKLDITNFPSHVHPLIGNRAHAADRDESVIVPAAGGNPGFPDTTSQTGAAGGDPANSNSTVAHTNLMPYKAGYWIKRTIREYVQPPY